MLMFSAVLQVLCLLAVVVGCVVLWGVGGGLIGGGLAGLYVGHAMDRAHT